MSVDFALFASGLKPCIDGVLVRWSDDEPVLEIVAVSRWSDRHIPRRRIVYVSTAPGVWWMLSEPGPDGARRPECVIRSATKCRLFDSIAPKYIPELFEFSPTPPDAPIARFPALIARRRPA